MGHHASLSPLHWLPQRIHNDNRTVECSSHSTRMMAELLLFSLSRSHTVCSHRYCASQQRPTGHARGEARPEQLLERRWAGALRILRP